MNRTEFLDEMSVLAVDIVLVTFLFVAIHQSVDVYSSFTFVPLHNLYQGVRRLLKECIYYKKCV